MERDQLLALVRKETGIKLSAADPVLAAATVNEILFENTLAKLDGSLKVAADRRAASVAQQAEASRQHIEDAKQAAAALVNNSMAWVTEQLKQAGEKMTAAMLTELRGKRLRRRLPCAPPGARRGRAALPRRLPPPRWPGSCSLRSDVLVLFWIDDPGHHGHVPPIIPTRPALLAARIGDLLAWHLVVRCSCRGYPRSIPLADIAAEHGRRMEAALSS